MTTHQLLALAPLRNGRLLRSNASLRSNDLIFLDDPRRKQILVGRPEIMPSVFAACGCDKSNIYSSKNKCLCCQADLWALHALSREALRVSNGTLEFRGMHAFVSVDSQPLVPEAASGDWYGKVEIKPGLTISFRQKTGNGKLEFRVVVADKVSRDVTDNNPNPGATTFCSKRSSSTSRTSTRIPPNLLKRPRTCANSETDNEIRLFICPFGQDLPSKRVELLYKKAINFGGRVVDSYLQATHLVVSDSVSSFDQLADNLSVSRRSLKETIDSVSLLCAFNVQENLSRSLKILTCLV